MTRESRPVDIMCRTADSSRDSNASTAEPTARVPTTSRSRVDGIATRSWSELIKKRDNSRRDEREHHDLKRAMTTFSVQLT
jgi:hypothetical protein